MRGVLVFKPNIDDDFGKIFSVHSEIEPYGIMMLMCVGLTAGQADLVPACPG
jgi:hypothetical protein